MSQPWMPKTAHDEAVLGVLLAMRSFGDAMDRMHGSLRDDMSMNATDLAALRMMIVREQRGQSVSPHELARHLRISTASTSKLLDRLSEAGHVRREPHPSDGRGRVVVLTEESRATFSRHFGERLHVMREVAGGYDALELAVVERFLGDMGDALDPG